MRRAPGARRATRPSFYTSTMSVGGNSSRLPPAAATGSTMAAAPGARASAASAASVALAVASETGAAARAAAAGRGGLRCTAACSVAKCAAAAGSRERKPFRRTLNTCQKEYFCLIFKVMIREINRRLPGDRIMTECKKSRLHMWLSQVETLSLKQTPNWRYVRFSV